MFHLKIHSKETKLLIEFFEIKQFVALACRCWSKIITFSLSCTFTDDLAGVFFSPILILTASDTSITIMQIRTLEIRIQSVWKKKNLKKFSSPEVTYGPTWSTFKFRIEVNQPATRVVRFLLSELNEHEARTRLMPMYKKEWGGANGVRQMRRLWEHPSYLNKNCTLKEKLIK